MSHGGVGFVNRAAARSHDQKTFVGSKTSMMGKYPQRRSKKTSCFAGSAQSEGDIARAFGERRAPIDSSSWSRAYASEDLPQ